MDLNKAILYGNLTRDPEQRALPSGVQVTSFSIATNRRYKDRDGNWQDAADFHNISVFGRQAETSAQYLKKGSGALIEGRIQTRSFDKDGQKHYRTEIIADRVQFGPRNDGGGGAPTNADKSSSKNETDTSKSDAMEYPEEEINPDDIPF